MVNYVEYVNMVRSSARQTSSSYCVLTYVNLTVVAITPPVSNTVGVYFFLYILGLVHNLPQRLPAYLTGVHVHKGFKSNAFVDVSDTT